MFVAGIEFLLLVSWFVLAVINTREDVMKTYVYSYQVKYPDGKTTTSTLSVEARDTNFADLAANICLNNLYPEAKIVSLVCIDKKDIPYEE